MTKLYRWEAAMPAIGIGLLLLAPTALAQQAVIDRCKETPSDADRIACLEAALLGQEFVQAAEPQSRIDPQSTERGTGTADAGASPATERPVPAEPVGIGAHQVISRNLSRDEQLERLEEAQGLQVASYDTVPFERLVIRLENGQVWRQIKGDTQQIRVTLRRNKTVDITESRLGGYKMHLNEMRRTVRVERIK